MGHSEGLVMPERGGYRFRGRVGGDDMDRQALACEGFVSAPFSGTLSACT